MPAAVTADVGQRRREVQQLAAQGLLRREIAERIGCHMNTVGRDLRAIASARTRPWVVNRTKTEERRRQVRQLKQQGKTVPEIACAVWCDEGLVRQDLERLRERRRAIRTLLRKDAKGVTVARLVAARFGCTPAVVEAELQDLTDRGRR